MPALSCPSTSPSSTAAAAGRAPLELSPDARLEEMSAQDARDLDTFVPAKPSQRAFDPPASPLLFDEGSARSPAGLRSIRRENRARIDAYNHAYRLYIERFADGAKHGAPEHVKKLLPPAPYAPLGGLPLAQRDTYRRDVMTAPALPLFRALAHGDGA